MIVYNSLTLPQRMAHRNGFQALFTDLYQLTMAQAYWQSGRNAQATFSLFFRTPPADRGFFVCAGIDEALDYLETFSFTAEDIDYLRANDLFDGRFLDWLQTVGFTGGARAMGGGDFFFAGEPVLEITAPIIEAQIVETFLINQINLQSLLATKAARGGARGRRKDRARLWGTPDSRYRIGQQAGPNKLHRRLRWHEQRPCGKAV